MQQAFDPASIEFDPRQTHSVIFKIAGACNLNCSYCYMYNMGDFSFQRRPRVMQREVAEAAIKRIAAHATENKLDTMFINLHGGEPLLVKEKWVRWFLDRLITEVPKSTKLEIGLQTNGMLITDSWIQLFSDFDIGVGVSIDGPEKINDEDRVDHKGRGSYKAVAKGIDYLVTNQDKLRKFGALVVVNPKHDPIEILDHLVSLGFERVDFLWPDYHHSNPPPWPKGTLSKYYTELFDYWYDRRDPSISIRFFEAVISGLLGHGSGIDALGPNPLSEVTIESDGSIEPVDVLRICGDGFNDCGTNVLDDEIASVRKAKIFQDCLNNQEILPEKCLQCPAYRVCGGGYMPHRFSTQNGFANPSVHCEDLLKVIGHIFRRLKFDIDRARTEVA